MIKWIMKFSYVNMFDYIFVCLNDVKGDDECVKMVGVDIVSEMVE